MNDRHDPRRSSRHVRRAKQWAWLCSFGLLSCRHLPKDCPEGASKEECLFTRSEAKSSTKKLPPFASSDDPTAPSASVLTAGGWTRIHTHLRGLADAMAKGISEQTIEERVRSWCDAAPYGLKGEPTAGQSPSPSPSAQSWLCPLPSVSEEFVQTIFLEYQEGSVSFSVPALGQAQSQLRLESLLSRWNRVCSHRLQALERAQRLEEFYTCELDGGAQLVLGRFPRDLEADLWQISIMLSP